MPHRAPPPAFTVRITILPDVLAVDMPDEIDIIPPDELAPVPPVISTSPPLDCVLELP